MTIVHSSALITPAIQSITNGIPGKAFGPSGRALVVPNGTDVYAFYNASSNDLVYTKSTDGGKTFAAPVTVDAGAIEFFCVWFDKWTPGDAGTLVHIWWLESTGSDVKYRNLDVSTDTFGAAAVTVFDGASVSIGGNNALTGAKMRGGNLLVAFDIDGGTETGCYRSTDGGANWTSRANPNEAASTDYYLMFPGNEADNQDAWLVFWDRSADELSLKTYDDSGDSWAEASIATGFADQDYFSAATSIYPQFAGAIRDSDNHLMLVAWNSYDVATADLACWDINGAGSITAKTNVNTDTDDCQCCGVSIDQTTDVIYVYYIGKSDGSEVVGTSTHLWRKQSADGGATWTGAVIVGYFSSNLAALTVNPGVSGTPRYAMALRITGGNDNYDLFGSYEVDTGGGGLAAPIRGGLIV